MELQKPKILYLLHAYQNRGGTEEHTKVLADAIGDHFETAIIARSGDEILFAQNNSLKTRYPAPHLNWPVTPLDDASAELALNEVITQFCPDIIHIQHFSNWHLGVLNQITATGIPTVLSLHDYYLLTPFYTNQYGAFDATNSPEKSRKLFSGDITPYLQKRLEFFKHSLKGIRAFVAPSTYLKRSIETKLPCQCTVIEHGIQHIAPTSARNENSLDFGYIGSLLPQKGWNILREAFRTIRDKIPNSTLHFFGDGEGVSQAEKANEQQIEFHGSYDRELLRENLSRFDVGIVPSLFEETFCLTLSELWSASKPVIVSDIGALGERVLNEVNGIKVAPGDPAALAEALLWFSNNNAWRSWEIEKPRKVEEMVVDYIALYRSLL